METTVDHAALKTNQAFIIALNILAFVFDFTWLAVLVMAVMVVGTLMQRPGFGFVYQHLLKPLGWVKPDVVSDHPEPHRFSQGFGAVVMAAAGAALLAGAGAPGWGLVWLVMALAALNSVGSASGVRCTTGSTGCTCPASSKRPRLVWRRECGRNRTDA